MNRIRMAVNALVLGLVVFFSLEHLMTPIHISPAAYLLVLASVITLLVARGVGHLPLWAVLAGPLIVFLGLKVWLVELNGTEAIPLAIMEGSLVVLATLLARWVTQAISEFESVVERISIGPAEHSPATPDAGQSCFYREVRRARNHQRPLALLAIEVDPRSVNGAVDRLVQEAQQAMRKQYALARVSKTLCTKLEDSDIVVLRNDRFLVMLPETTPENLGGLVERLRQQVLEETGILLKVGAASLPADCLTLKGLVDQASQQLEEVEPQPCFLELDSLSVKQQL